ncbi:MAG TPA: outer membrane beta-barrel protein [Flavisolibacter sp.]|nr:outer membrane beta-barrel protein [Flavisolibacter sp.]
MRHPARYFFLLLFLLPGMPVLAQKISGRITGIVVSDSSRQPLAGATISLIDAKDSSAEKLDMSNDRGRFILSGLRLASYYLIITQVGHEVFEQRVSLSDSVRELNLDTVMLLVKSQRLDEVLIVRQQLPMVIKTDTVEFNAGSFKVKENAMVEDLLKKLPGVEVARDGSVKAHGEAVTQIYVDGKPFFGNDPKMATQNLPADIIDKVQVIDKKSEQSRVTKVEDGQVEKIINITIKKDKKKGRFGRAYAGYGTQERYEARGSGNYFHGDKKISLVASGTNTGRTEDGTGQGSGGSFGGSGISNELNSRLVYTNKIGEHLDINGNIGYSYNRNDVQSVRQRQTILGDSINFYMEQSSSRRKRSGINLGLNLEYEPDTLTRLQMGQWANFAGSSNFSRSFFLSSLASKRKLNEGERTNEGSGNSPSFNGNLTASRRLRKPGRAVFLNFNHAINQSLNDGFNISNNYFYPLSSPDYERLLNQFSNNENRGSNINASAGYSEPLGRKISATLSFAYGYTRNQTVRETFDFNALTELYDLLNDTLSNRFDNYSYSRSAGLTLSRRFKKSNLSIGTTWQNSRTKSISLDNDSVYQQSFSGLVPFVNYNTNGKGKRISAGYQFSSRAPQAYQLQAIVDNSNPLFLRLGNPSLRYSTSHRLNFNMNLFTQKSGLSLNVNSNLNLTVNNIATSTSFDKLTGIQTSQPVNVDGVYNGYVRAYLAMPVKFIGKKKRWYANATYNYSKNINLLNGEENISRSANARFATGMDVEIGELADFRIGYADGWQTVTYSLRREQNNRTRTYGFELGMHLTPGKMNEVDIDWDYNRNTGSAIGFNREINMVNASVTRYLDKKKSWWVKLRVYDLLKQNVSVFRYSGENFIEDMQSNILTRYYLLALNVKLNQFGERNR